MQARPIAPHRASRHPSAGPAAIVAASVQIAAERRERTRARREGRASGKHACQGTRARITTAGVRARWRPGRDLLEGELALWDLIAVGAVAARRLRQGARHRRHERVRPLRLQLLTRLDP